jgi:hypothetical protein
MKKIFFAVLGICLMYGASAQLFAGVNANYSMYKGDFQKSTPGVQVRLGYDFEEKITGILGFTYGFPIKEPSTSFVMDQYGNSQDVASEIKYNFKTIHFLVDYTFVGDQESAGKFYGIAGAGLVLVSYKESITGNYNQNTYSPGDQIHGSTSGFTLNFGLGGEYKLTGTSLFGEAGVSIPANNVNNYYVYNPIPAHFFINAGLKFYLTSNK